ncbi:MAG: hypothetical protein DMD49_12670 [Gemmatimonadetes bacterium]|nr:MAG: hypothetical protein DMD49_12670 [Gemmatimonadota bacterium]
MADRVCNRGARDGRRHHQVSARRHGRGGAGAVACAGRRAGAEQALAGKRIDDRTAAAAAEAALQGARPMSRNGYKVQVAKTAVKRAILQAGGIKTA